MVDGEVVTESGGIHRGAEKVSSSGEDVSGRGRCVALRGRVGIELGLGSVFLTVQAAEDAGAGRQGRQKLAPLQFSWPNKLGVHGRESSAPAGACASGSGCSQP